jgi:hypothetical protein
LVAHLFTQKVLNFCEKNSHMVNHSNFLYVTFYPPHENLVLEIKLLPGVVRVFTLVWFPFRPLVHLPNVDGVDNVGFR